MAATLLIIEDNLELLRLLRELLADRFEVVTAISGEKGLELARAEVPDLALVDVELPGMDGVTTATALKELAAPADVRILILTAHAGVDEETRIRASGCCDDFLAKPAPLVAIRERLERLLSTGATGGAADSTAFSGAGA